MVSRFNWIFLLENWGFFLWENSGISNEDLRENSLENSIKNRKKQTKVSPQPNGTHPKKTSLSITDKN
jgi:hypothetical protein